MPFPRLLSLLLLPLLLCQCSVIRHPGSALPSERAPSGPAAGNLTSEAEARWRRVSARMTAAGRAPVEWRFSKTPDSAVNASSWPDGRISVTVALLRFVKSDGELAAVLAHEMAHVELRHGQKRTAASVLTVLTAAAAAWALHEFADTSVWESGGLAAGALLTFSPAALLPKQRKHELEADAHSLVILRRAGFHPAAAVTFWERYTALRHAGGRPVNSPLSAHPPDRIRLNALRAALVTDEASAEGR